MKVSHERASVESKLCVSFDVGRRKDPGAAAGHPKVLPAYAGGINHRSAMTDTFRITAARDGRISESMQTGFKSTSTQSNTNRAVSVLQGSVPCGTSYVLLIDSDADHSERLAHCLESAGIVTETVVQLSSAAQRLRQNGKQYDVVVVDISNPTKDWSRIVHDLQEVAYQSDRQLGPLFLCISRLRRSPELQLALERKGARVAFEG